MGIDPPIPELIGRRIRRRRLAMDMTQARLGRMIGVRFQQIHRYEQGENNISAVTLWKISDALEEPIETFFAGLPKACAKTDAGQ